MVREQAAAWPHALDMSLSQDGKFSFSLESVKKLRDLGDLQEPTRRSSAMVPNPCNYPNFPEELKPLCKERNAREILQRLGE